MNSDSQGSPILRMAQIHKTFPGVVALDDVQLEVRRGEVHAIVGENGAGKSTLMKILAGVYRQDSGRIFINDEAVEFQTPGDAIAQGIAVIYQEIPLVPPFSALDNVYLGRERITAARAIDKRAQRGRYEALCERVGVRVPPDTLVRDLTRGQAQQVEILKALDRDAEIIVMDEPTASLDQASKEALFRTVRVLREQGKTFIFITHFIGEVFELADRITVLRDGHNVATLDTASTTPNEIVSLMIGHTVSDAAFVRRMSSDAEPLLEVRNLSVQSRLHDISFVLRQGEILGLAGLVGSGRSELMLALYGRLPLADGEVLVRGQKVHISSPHEAIGRRIGLVPEDRKRAGLLLNFPVSKNLSLSSLKTLSPHFVIRFGEERRLAEAQVARLRISTPTVDQLVRYLSGGNQQKVVFGRILATEADILLLDEPTQGIDVGAKEEIFHLMHRLSDEGKGVIFVSSELKEIAAVCDRALVLKDGRLVCELGRDEMSEARLMQAAILGANPHPQVLRPKGPEGRTSRGSGDPEKPPQARVEV